MDGSLHLSLGTELSEWDKCLSCVPVNHGLINVLKCLCTNALWSARYEGTGRSLSLKLIGQLRQQSGVGGAGGRVLKEVVLDEPIRYSPGDPVERWLYDVLCLDSTSVRRVASGCPPPPDCELYGQ